MQKLSGGKELLVHPDVLGFYQRVLDKFRPAPGKRIALFLPCSAEKPYSNSKTHKTIKKALMLGLGNKVNYIEEFIVSEPMAIVPRRWEDRYPAAHYNMKLDSWFPVSELPKLRERGEGNNISIARKEKKINWREVLYIKRTLIDRISRVLCRLNGKYEFYVAYLRGTHREMFQRACRNAKISPILLPTRSVVSKVIRKRGTFYYIMNGIRDSTCLAELAHTLRKVEARCYSNSRPSRPPSL